MKIVTDLGRAVDAVGIEADTSSPDRQEEKQAPVLSQHPRQLATCLARAYRVQRVAW